MLHLILKLNTDKLGIISVNPIKRTYLIDNQNINYMIKNNTILYINHIKMYYLYD